jgi:carboxyl-terminal processing protease
MDAAVVVLAACFAAPAPGAGPFDAPAGSRPLKDEAHEFAGRLLTAADALSSRYIRPIRREDLLVVGLTAMYERAKRPVPKGLADALKDAAADKGAPAPDDFESFGSEIGSDFQFALAVRIQYARENLGEVKELDGRDGLAACCGAMARALDPYSGVVTPAEQRHNLGDDAEREAFGFEIDDFVSGGPLTVKSVASGGPAQRAGMHVSDTITHLDGRSVADLERSYLLETLRFHEAGRYTAPSPSFPAPGDLGTQGKAGPPPRIKASVTREGGKPRVMILECEQFRPETVLGVSRRDDNSWNYWLDRKSKLAHLRVASFDHGTAAELRRVVSQLRDDGARGLVLDLRWCPGGFLEEAVGGAQVFLDEGVVATLKARDKEDQVYRSDGTGAVKDLPLVVLVNGETSGGAELLAAALQDRDRAVVVGQRTRGKASVQTSFPVTGAPIVLKVTNGEFVRPSGKPLHRAADARAADDWGVRPDDGLESRVSAELSASLKADWQRQTLRPGGDIERLPMDDLDADPQLQAAVEALKARLK